MFDVVIIGAGPAGTNAAYDLVSAGYRVLLLDKCNFPRKKACAGGITPKAYALFRYDISSVVKQQCRTMKITPAKGDSFLIKSSTPLCYMTQRKDLDLLALNKAVEKGVKFETVKKIQSIEEKMSHVEIRTNDRLIRANYLIGADGANSLVRRRMSKQTFKVTRYPAIEADVRVRQPDLYKMEFDFSMSKNGYYWIFPKHDHVNIGIYSTAARPGLKRQHLVDYALKRFSTNRLEAFKGYPIGVGGYFYCPGSHYF